MRLIFLNYIEIFFVAVSILFVLLLITHKAFVSKIKDSKKISPYIAGVTSLLLTYVLTALFLAVFLPGIVNKFAMVLFAMSPFIIGHFATYEKENFYSILQILCVIISDVYIMII